MVGERRKKAIPAASTSQPVCGWQTLSRSDYEKRRDQRRPKDKESATLAAIARADGAIQAGITRLRTEYDFKRRYPLCPKLKAVCDDYLVSAKLVPDVRIAQQRQELKRLTLAAGTLQQAIRDLSADAESRLLSVLQHKLSTRWREDTWRASRSIAKTARQALQTLPNDRGGRPADAAFRQLIAELVGIYESGTEKKAGLSRNEALTVDPRTRQSHRLYRGPFFRFASDCCSILDLNSSNNALGATIERVLRARKLCKP